MITTEELQCLTRFDTPTIANALESLGLGHVPCMGPAIRAMTALRTPIAGIAVTGASCEQWGAKFDHLDPWLRFLEEIERTPVPAIAIVKDTSRAPWRDAMIGEGMSRVMRAAGAAGVICDGAIRDVPALRNMEYPVFARSMVAGRGGIRFQKFQIPVDLDGLTIAPGDLIHADENGALTMPAERVSDILEAAAGVVRKEQALYPMFARPTFRVADLEEHYRKMRLAR